MATFTPRPVIGQRMELANELIGQALRGRRSTSPLSPVANALQGLVGGFQRGRANRAIEGNQQVRQQLFEQASGGNADLARLLMQSGDPQLQNAGINVAQQQAGRAQQQANADRAFGLREREFEARQAERAQSADIDRQELELKIASAQRAGGFKDAKQKADVEGGLRKEFVKASAPFTDSRDAFRRVMASENTGAGDVSLIFNFMKTLDPGSTVREGEFATAEQTAGIPGRVVQQYNKAITGERLTQDQRAEFKSQAEVLFERQKQQHEQRVTQFGGIAGRLGITPENVLIDLQSAPELQQAQSAQGPQTVATPEEAAKLPSGTQFRDPAGVLRVVP